MSGLIVAGRHATLERGALIRALCALGTTQIISWGSLYYSIGVLAGPMSASLGLAQSLIFGAFSLGLMVSGFASPAAGRAIDQRGGRAVLMTGSLLSAAALACIAMAQGPVTLLLGWALAGLAMATALYDAAFPAMSQFAGPHYRKSLTALTLFGGLASTAFWPLAWQFNAWWDWRITLLSFAAMQIIVCLPLHRFFLPQTQAHQRPDAPALHGQLRRSAAHGLGASYLWLAVALTINAFLFSAIAAHVVAALVASGHSPANAVFAAALIGPMQVLGRITEFLFANRWPATRVGVVALTLATLSMLLLWQAGLALWMATAFALVYGGANGVMTIVRGTVPAELFGKERYGELMGLLARPSFFAKAIAPLLISLMLDAGISHPNVALGLGLMSGLSLIAFLLALRARRTETQNPELVAAKP